MRAFPQVRAAWWALVTAKLSQTHFPGPARKPSTGLENGQKAAEVDSR